MNTKEQIAFDLLKGAAPVPAGFRVSRVHTIVEPHPYCIGTKHVAYASYRGGILDESSIEGAEKAGARCCMNGCNLSYKEHKSSLALVIVLPNDAPKDLNKIPNLVEYLNDIKPAAEAAKVEGFVFPSEQQEQRARE